MKIIRAMLLLIQKVNQSKLPNNRLNKQRMESPSLSLRIRSNKLKNKSWKQVKF